VQNNAHTNPRKDQCITLRYYSSHTHRAESGLHYQPILHTQDSVPVCLFQARPGTGLVRGCHVAWLSHLLLTRLQGYYLATSPVGRIRSAQILEWSALRCPWAVSSMAMGFTCDSSCEKDGMRGLPHPDGHSAPSSVCRIWSGIYCLKRLVRDR
jgi:hypothetical protein